MQATITVDALTWGLLWPMLSRSPDPERVAFYRTQFFSFTSYNTVRGAAGLPALVGHPAVRGCCCCSTPGRPGWCRHWVQDLGPGRFGA